MMRNSHTGQVQLKYNYQKENGYICRQRTRIEQKPSALHDWSFVAHLIMITCCLAAFLYIISEDLLMPKSTHGHYQHHQQQRSVEKFLRTQEEKIVQFASTASNQIDSVLHEVADNMNKMHHHHHHNSPHHPQEGEEIIEEDEVPPPEEETMPEKIIPPAHTEDEVVEVPKEEEAATATATIPEPIIENQGEAAEAAQQAQQAQAQAEAAATIPEPIETYV